MQTPPPMAPLLWKYSAVSGAAVLERVLHLLFLLREMSHLGVLLRSFLSWLQKWGLEDL